MIDFEQLDLSIQKSNSSYGDLNELLKKLIEIQNALDDLKASVRGKWMKRLVYFGLIVEIFYQTFIPIILLASTDVLQIP